MGGVSTGRMHGRTVQGRAAFVLSGDVSLDNNGGFIQMAADFEADGALYDASAHTGIELDMCGNGERYDVRLRTDALTRPWQSFRTDVATTPDWQTVRLAFDQFAPHKTDAIFDLARLRRIGILAIGRVFHAQVALGGLRFY